MFGGDLWCGINGDTDELQIATSAHVSLSTYRSHVKYKAHSATRCFQSQEANSLLSVKIMFQDSKDKLVLGTVDFKAKKNGPSHAIEEEQTTSSSSADRFV